MAEVRPRQPAYEIFSIKRRFQQSSPDPKWVMQMQMGTDMLFIINFCDLLLQHKIQK